MGKHIAALVVLAVISAPGAFAQQPMTRLVPNAGDRDYGLGAQLAFAKGDLWVGTNHHGVIVFDLNEKGWVAVDTLLADEEGGKIDIQYVRADSLVALTGGGIVSYTKPNGNWIAGTAIELPNLQVLPQGSGRSYDLISDSLLVVSTSVSATMFSTGYVEIFRLSGTEWSLTQTISPAPTVPDGFTFACSFKDRLVFGAPRDPIVGNQAGSVYVYRRETTGDYVLEQRIYPSDLEEGDQFGRIVACGSTDLAIHSYSGGKTYLYSRADTVWSLSDTIRIPESDNRFLSLKWLGDSLLVRDEQEVSAGSSTWYESTLYLMTDSPNGWQIANAIKNPNAVDIGIETDDGGFGYVSAADGDFLAVSASFRNTAEFEDTGEVYVFRLSELSTSIEEEVPPARSFDLYPNPASGIVLLQGDIGTSGSAQIRVFDMLGRSVASRDDLHNGEGRTAVDVSALPTGVYLVSVCSSSNNCNSRKLVVSR